MLRNMNLFFYDGSSRGIYGAPVKELKLSYHNEGNPISYHMYPLW